MIFVVTHASDLLDPTCWNMGEQTEVETLKPQNRTSGGPVIIFISIITRNSSLDIFPERRKFPRKRDCARSFPVAMHIGSIFQSAFSGVCMLCCKFYGKFYCKGKSKTPKVTSLPNAGKQQEVSPLEAEMHNSETCNNLSLIYILHCSALVLQRTGVPGDVLYGALHVQQHAKQTTISDYRIWTSVSYYIPWRDTSSFEGSLIG